MSRQCLRGTTHSVATFVAFAFVLVVAGGGIGKGAGFSGHQVLFRGRSTKHADLECTPSRHPTTSLSTHTDVLRNNSI